MKEIDAALTKSLYTLACYAAGRTDMAEKITEKALVHILLHRKPLRHSIYVRRGFISKENGYLSGIRICLEIILPLAVIRLELRYWR